MRRRDLVCMGLAILSSCARTDVARPRGRAYPPREKGCDVRVFENALPDYRCEDIGSVRVECNAVGHDDCMRKVRDGACKLGGDTVYGVRESEGFIMASVGLAAAYTPPPAQPPPPPVSCNPPCSPGYTCQNGFCAALCNPACRPGTQCGPDRICR